MSNSTQCAFCGVQATRTIDNTLPENMFPTFPLETDVPLCAACADDLIDEDAFGLQGRGPDAEDEGEDCERCGKKGKHLPEGPDVCEECAGELQQEADDVGHYRRTGSSPYDF